ncbi:uncharacterized protein LOC117785106 [Drosophila innubila]|uniref:uncharacterized protein LOC117785106 n=1 Tax=Drosophila innubila TaxID=198719 RepID=UPI00148D4BAA|nr:uncharacterized protein LOC117785106 [Drosophila innubila]
MLVHLTIDLKPTLFLFLCLVSYSVNGEISNVSHYSQSLFDSIMEIYMGNNSIGSYKNSTQAFDPHTAILVPISIYPYILLAIWIISILIIICCCLYCKCQQAEMVTSYSSNNFELQEVHIMDHPLPHVKGCVCLCCLQRQLAQEIQQKRN